MAPPDQPHIPSMAPLEQPYIPPMAPPEQTLAPTQRPRVGRESSRVWTVQVIDEQGNTKKTKLTKSGVFEMPRGERIVVPFDRQKRAYGEAATLLLGACGRISTDSKNIPINFESWIKVPKSYKDDCFNTLKNLFHFQASELIAKRYCSLSMSSIGMQR
ncbi:uncharacterized protein LOC114917077 [Cajanus cajan]|uniref:uncharacterized protein LOC114917077 n=1 Tax=Cajanus cajan TaxID=3821 RepID=UPI0010FB5DB8|nr:uncharacterized protein LOC114917077 [Cajanus cajan]